MCALEESDGIGILVVVRSSLDEIEAVQQIFILLDLETISGHGQFITPEQFPEVRNDPAELWMRRGFSTEQIYTINPI